MKKALLIEDDINGMTRAIRAAHGQKLHDTYIQYLRKDIDIDWVKSFDEFCAYINTYYKTHKTLPDYLYFDHDLSDDAYELWHKHKGYKHTDINYDEYVVKTGYHCAKWLVDFCIDNNIKFNCEVHAHSMNNKGRTNILSILQNFKNHQAKYE